VNDDGVKEHGAMNARPSLSFFFSLPPPLPLPPPHGEEELRFSEGGSRARFFRAASGTSSFTRDAGIHAR